LIAESSKFLASYSDSLSKVCQGPQPGVHDKGKAVLGHTRTRRTSSADDDGEGACKRQTWRRPPQDWVKVNTYAAFCENSGKASAGIVTRGSNGKVLLTAWRVLRD
jgi:hypothetical protein